MCVPSHSRGVAHCMGPVWRTRSDAPVACVHAAVYSRDGNCIAWATHWPKHHLRVQAHSPWPAFMCVCMPAVLCVYHRYVPLPFVAFVSLHICPLPVIVVVWTLWPPCTTFCTCV